MGFSIIGQMMASTPSMYGSQARPISRLIQRASDTRRAASGLRPTPMAAWPVGQSRATTAEPMKP
jgi:hypothetical protein